MSKKVIEPVAVQGTGTVEQESDITVEMQPVYTFRKLSSTDMFLMFKIIGRIGINDLLKSFGEDKVKEIASVVTGNKNENALTLVGVTVTLELVNFILANIHKCERDIYELLSNTSNLSFEQVKELDFATFTGMVIDFIKKEEFKDFIKVVLKSFKPVK